MKWLGASSAGAAGEPAPSMQLHHPSANGHIPTVCTYFIFFIFYLIISTRCKTVCLEKNFTRDRNVITYHSIYFRKYLVLDVSLTIYILHLYAFISFLYILLLASGRCFTPLLRYERRFFYCAYALVLHMLMLCLIHHGRILYKV